MKTNVSEGTAIGTYISFSDCHWFASRVVNRSSIWFVAITDDRWKNDAFQCCAPHLSDSLHESICRWNFL